MTLDMERPVRVIEARDAYVARLAVPLPNEGALVDYIEAGLRTAAARAHGPWARYALYWRTDRRWGLEVEVGSHYRAAAARLAHAALMMCPDMVRPA